jgi:hypothetical protein
MRHVRQLPFEFEGLVVHPPGLRAVAAADDRHSQTLPPQPPGGPRDHRRLAGPPQCQIADADHGNPHPADKAHAAIVAPVSPADGQPVGNLDCAEGRAQARGPQAAAAPADQVAKFTWTEHQIARVIGVLDKVMPESIAGEPRAAIHVAFQPAAVRQPRLAEACATGFRDIRPIRPRGSPTSRAP